MKKTTKASTPLYTFNWASGGYNQVHAVSKPEALKRIREAFPLMRPLQSSFKRLTSVEAQDAYWKSISLFD